MFEPLTKNVTRDTFPKSKRTRAEGGRRFRRNETTAGFPQVGIDRETLLLRKSGRIKRKSRPLGSHFAQYFSSGRRRRSLSPFASPSTSGEFMHKCTSELGAARKARCRGWNFIASVAECSLVLFPYLLKAIPADLLLLQLRVMMLWPCDLHAQFCIFCAFHATELLMRL